MEQPKEPGFYWALVSRGGDRETARWEPISWNPGSKVLGSDPNWAIWDYGPRIEPPAQSITFRNGSRIKFSGTAAPYTGIAQPMFYMSPADEPDAPR